MNTIKTFSPNLLGRDICVGDLHGQFDMLNKLLEHVKFDPTVDRLFSVGDLIDRGTQNLECMQLLDKDWFHACQSNHGEMAIEAYFGHENSVLGANWFVNGGIWSVELWKEWMDHKTKGTPMSETAAELHRLVLKSTELPVLMTINHRNGKKFHIIHAEFPFQVLYSPLTDAQLQDPAKVHILNERRLDRYGIERSMLWLRYLFGSFFTVDMTNESAFKRKVANAAKSHGVNMREIFTDKLSHIISGHTILQRPFTMVGQTNIDTGSGKDQKRYKWAGVTALILDDWTFWKARYDGVTQVQPVVMTHEDFDHGA